MTFKTFNPLMHLKSFFKENTETFKSLQSLWDIFKMELLLAVKKRRMRVACDEGTKLLYVELQAVPFKFLLKSANEK